MTISSVDLANTIINITKHMDLEPYEDNELVKAIRDEEANPPQQVALLLGFRSNLKYQLIQADGQLDKQRHILMRFFAETNLQKAIPSFQLTGMDIDDYVNLLQAYQAVYHAHESHESEDGLKQNLIAAENKLDQILDRMFGGTCQFIRVMQNESTSYPHLLGIINKIQSGDRMQIVYIESFNHKNINECLIGLDVEKVENTCRIFCFSNMPAANLESFVNQLSADVVGSVVKACAAPMPTSRNADKLIAIAALGKFSKYPHVFSYFPESSEKMIPLSLLPTNIIAMNQSNQTIKSVLEEAKHKNLFDLDIDLFIAMHKPKHLADEQEYKEIYREHEQAIRSVSHVPAEDTVDNKYEIIRDLKNGKEVDLKKYMIGMFDEHERLAYLLGLSSSIFTHNKVHSPFEFDQHINVFTSQEIAFLKRLRAECMALIGDSIAMEEDIFHAGNKLLFQVNLD